MRVGILGSGDVGRALGTGFVGLGHEVRIGSRDAANERAVEWAGGPDMFFCGNDDDAKATVEEILTAFGWPSIDIGGIEGARVLEPMCILWVLYAFKTGGWGHAFKMLRK